MAQFLLLWYNFYEHYVCRGKRLISETNLSKCNKCYKMGTGAASRYKLQTKPANGSRYRSIIVSTGAESGLSDMRVME